MFLSVLASTFFCDEYGWLDVTRFVSFMAILAGVVHVIGAFTLRTPSITKTEVVIRDGLTEDEESASGQNTERTPLITPKTASNVQVTVVPVEHEHNIFDLLKDPHFWLLALIVLVGLGSVSSSFANL